MEKKDQINYPLKEPTLDTNNLLQTTAVLQISADEYYFSFPILSPKIFCKLHPQLSPLEQTESNYSNKAPIGKMMRRGGKCSL